MEDGAGTEVVVVVDGGLGCFAAADVVPEASVSVAVLASVREMAFFPELVGRRCLEHGAEEDARDAGEVDLYGEATWGVVAAVHGLDGEVLSEAA